MKLTARPLLQRSLGVAARHRGTLWCIVLLGAVVAAAYAPVLIGGRTLSGASYATGTNGFSPFPGQQTIGSEDPVRLDVGASAWQFEPWAEVTREALWDGELPLWNPYQGAGAPLAANAQSAVLDPMLLPVNLFPSPWLWDLTLIGALVAAASGFLLYGHIVGLGYLAATTTGTVYALSGFFFLHANNGFIRTYAYLPFLLAAVEWCLRRRDSLPVVALAVATAGCLLAGMPESAFLVLVAVGGYALWRLLQYEERARNAVRLLVGSGLGAALAAPFVFPFAEYVGLSHNLHGSESGAGAHTEAPRLLLGWLIPFVGGDRWGTRSWVGAVALFLAILGLLANRRRRHIAWPSLVIGLVATLKVVGFPLVGFIGGLPLFERVGFVAWLPPVIAAMLAILAGLGVESLARGEVDTRTVIASVGIMFVLVGWGLWANEPVFAAATTMDVLASVGLALGAVVLVAAAWHLSKRRAAAIALAVVIGELLVLAPFSHYAVRADPYQPDAWHQKLVALADDGSEHRMFALDGLLFPNTAGVFGLSDIRMLDALYVDRYWRYIELFVEPEIGSRFVGGPYSVDEERTRAHIVGNPMFDLLGVKHVVASGEINQSRLQERLEGSIDASPALRGGYMDLGLGWHRYAFFQHAPNRTPLPLEPPLHGVLSFRYGLDRAAFVPESGSDGVTFGVDAVRASGATERLWSQNVEPGQDEFVVGWRGHSLVVEDDTVDPVHALVLITEALGNSAMDWSGWIDLEFDRVGAETLTTRFLDSIEQTPGLRGAFVDENEEMRTRALFQHSPGDLELPIEGFAGGVLSFRYGLALEAMDPAAGSDGVRFAVEVGPHVGERQRLWSAEVRPGPMDASHRWAQAEVALEAEDPTDRVWLLTEPIGNTVMDWSGWADLEFTSPDEEPASFLDQDRPQLSGPVIANGTAVVYENTNASPRAFVVNDVHAVSSLDDAESWFRERSTESPDRTLVIDGVDPTRTAVVETAGGVLPSGLDAEPCEGESAAQITDYRHNSVRIGATTACPGLLVLTDVYMPGWEATVNGQEARVLPTDIAFRGVAIPAGDSVVEFSYRPASFRNGVVLMGLALVVLAGLVVRDRRRGTT